jgi:hypothetical protein
MARSGKARARSGTEPPAAPQQRARGMTLALRCPSLQDHVPQNDPPPPEPLPPTPLPPTPQNPQGVPPAIDDPRGPVDPSPRREPPDASPPVVARR